MGRKLPADLLLLICEELANVQDFRTLFNCALTGRELVGPALEWLYRNYDQSRIISSEGNDAEWSKTSHLSYQARINRTISKWALLWKSIIRSSLGHTAYPYCLYIRTLDLRNLTELLMDNLFRDTALNGFFADDMARFLKAQGTPMRRTSKSSLTRLMVPDILELVGESITHFVSETARRSRKTVALEELTGDINSVALTKWAGRLARLRSMTLWDGNALNGEVANAIVESCPNFDELTFFSCSQEDADQNLAAFFSGLNTNTLRSFEVFTAARVGPETLLALNHHSRSLKELKLDGLRTEAIKNINLLQGCDTLEVLELKDADGQVKLETTENDVFLEIIEWLGRCGQLKKLQLSSLVDAPAILTQLCLRNNIRLRSLHVIGYPMMGNQDFHKSLTHQRSLEILELRADAEGAFRDDIDTLVSSICELTELKDLDLMDTSDYFRTAEISKLAFHLLKLEALTVGGYEVGDNVWHNIAGLHHLRTLNINAVTSFTFDALLNYVSTLQDTNTRLQLAVLYQNGDYDLAESQVAEINEAIGKKVDGRFDFGLYREAESSIASDSD